MKKILAVFAVLSLLVVGGVALADDPDGDLQTIQNKADQISVLAGEIKDLAAGEAAKPPVVTTVTETTTAPPVTVTETVTETVTATAPPPDPACTGTDVPPGAGLKAAMDAAPAGTTFCLSAGTYTVSSTIIAKAGIAVIGAGRAATHIDGSGLPITAPGIFDLGTGLTTFTKVDVFGAPTPLSGSSCGTGSDCGKAFIIGEDFTFTDSKCHDNMGSCIGGGGGDDLVVDNIECYNNGSAYSANNNFEYAACIKRGGTQTGGDNNTDITNSYIHDNYRNGLWCDFCRNGVYHVEGNTITNNGKSGIDYEVSGGFDANDRAIIRNNIIQGNNTRNDIVGAGIILSTSQDLTAEGNTFGGTLGGKGVRLLYVSSRVPSIWATQTETGIVLTGNTMNGDTLPCATTGVTCSGNVDTSP